MELAVGSVCDRGLSAKRPVNEDRALVLPEFGLFVVCDGVGGHSSGEVASQLAVDTIEEAFREAGGAAPSELIARAVQYANRDIYETAASRPEFEGMATTVALLHLDASDGAAIVGHAGDSRVYRFDGRSIHRETYDHTDLDDAVRAGRLTREQAVAQGKQNTINRALGIEHDVQVEFKTLRASEGEAFLLCSDGVTRHIDDAELEGLFGELYARGASPGDMCGRIKELCYARGAEDNLTAVVVLAGAPRRGRAGADEATREHARAGAPGERSARRAGAQKIEIGFEPEPALDATEARAPRRSSGPSRLPLLAVLACIAVAVAAFWVGRNSLAWWPRPGSIPPATNQPAPPAPAAGAARDAFERGDMEAARAGFAQLAAQEPNRADYQYWLGRVAERQGDSARAAEYFERAVAIDRTFGDAYVFLAAAYERAGKHDDAASALRRYAESGRR